MSDDGSKPADNALARARGYEFPVYEWLGRKDPDFARRRVEYGKELYAPSGDHALPVKYREMVIAVVLAFRQATTIKPHLKRALQEGATLEELIEAFEVASLPGGFPTAKAGFQALMELDQESGA